MGLTMEPRACETCGAPAEWGVADVQDNGIATPNPGHHAVITLRVRAVHWYCDPHRRPVLRYDRFGIPYTTAA